MLLKKVNLRLDENMLNEIEELKNNDNKNTSDMIRELLEIGIKEKNKSKNMTETKDEKWEKYFKKVALKNMETRGLVQMIFNTVFDPEKSKYATADEEAAKLKEYIEKTAKSNGLFGEKQSD